MHASAPVSRNVGPPTPEDRGEPAEFHRYWKDEHGPLVRSVAQTLGIRRYVQSHTIDTPINDALQASRSTEPRSSPPSTPAGGSTSRSTGPCGPATSTWGSP